jgi:hypothetical protein
MPQLHFLEGFPGWKQTRDILIYFCLFVPILPLNSSGLPIVDVSLRDHFYNIFVPIICQVKYSLTANFSNCQLMSSSTTLAAPFLYIHFSLHFHFCITLTSALPSVDQHTWHSYNEAPSLPRWQFLFQV